VNPGQLVERSLRTLPPLVHQNTCVTTLDVLMVLPAELLVLDLKLVNSSRVRLVKATKATTTRVTTTRVNTRVFLGLLATLTTNTVSPHLTNPTLAIHTVPTQSATPVETMN